MNEQRIREIANQSSEYAETTIAYTGSMVPYEWEARLMKARDLKFTELILKEFSSVIEGVYQSELHSFMDEWERGNLNGLSRAIEIINEHFGVSAE